MVYREGVIHWLNYIYDILFFSPNLCCSCCQITCTCFQVFISVLWCLLRFPHIKTMQKIRLDSHLFCRGFMFSLLFVFIYVFWCPTRFPYQMMFMSLNSNTMGVTCGAGTANPSGAPVLNGVRVAQSLVFCVMFCT